MLRNSVNEIFDVLTAAAFAARRCARQNLFTCVASYEI